MSVEILEQYEKVQAHLKEVGSKIAAHRTSLDSSVKELGARIGNIEQVVANQDGSFLNGGYDFGSGVVSMAGQAIENISDNAAFANLKEWNAGTCRLSLKAPIKAALTNDQGSSTGGIPSHPERTGIYPGVMRRLRLLDYLNTRPTERDSVEYVRLSSVDNAAEQSEEGEEKAEIELTGELVKSEIATIAAHSTASKQVLSDHQALQGAINLLIEHKLLSRLEHQIINGDGSSGKINGFEDQSAVFVNSLASLPADIIGEALMSMDKNGFTPSLILLNPQDWFLIQITKTMETSDATEVQYQLGKPTDAFPPVLWNVPVVTTPSVAAGKAYTLDTSYITVLDRESSSILLSNSHKDYFTRNLVAILGELRAGLEVIDEYSIFQVELYPS